jgi:hypothetical protein
MAESIKISLELADAAAQKSLSDFISRSAQADKALGKLGSTGKSSFDSLTVSIGKSLGVYDLLAGNLLANVVSKGFASISESIGKVIEEASASEQAITNLNVALQGAGLYTPKASKDLQDFAASLQGVTKYSDEAVLSSASLLLNLTTLNQKGIEKATEAAVNLAATLNIDLATATEMISKAVNGNYTAFQKQGIAIQSAQTDAGRLTNILKALEFTQGKAKDQALTYAGATEKAKNAQSELFEAIGKVFTQSQFATKSQQSLNDLYSKAADFVTRNTDAFRDFATTLKIVGGIALAGAATYVAVSAGLGLMGVAAFAGTTAFGALGLAASAAWLAITGPIGLVVAGVGLAIASVYFLVRNWDLVKIKTYEAIAAILEFGAKSAGLFSDKAAAALNEQAKAYRQQATDIKAASEAARLKVEQDAKNNDAGKQQEDARRARLLQEQKEVDLHNSLLLAKKNAINSELFLSESQFYIQTAQLSSDANQDRLALEGNLSRDLLKQFLQDSELRLIEQQKVDQQELDAKLAKQLAIAQSEKDDQKRKEAVDEANQQAQLARAQLGYQQNLTLQKKNVADKALLDKKDLANRDQTLSLFAGLSSSSNKELAAIGKASALTQLAIKTPEAVGNSYAFGTKIGGPPLGFIFGGIAAAAMAAQAAQIAGVQFEEGGIVPGNSFSGDKVQARVNSGEMILNRQQQAQLFKSANGEGGGNLADKVDRLSNAIGQLISQPLIVNIDGRELFNITRSGLASGRTF